MGRMDDGYQTLIDISGTVMWEKSVTPPGLDGGGEIDTTVMQNATYRTRAPKALVTLTNCSFTAAYDPAALTTLLSDLNVNQLITITFPDGSTLAFWGWLNSFVPGESARSWPLARRRSTPNASRSLRCLGRFTQPSHLMVNMSLASSAGAWTRSSLSSNKTTVRTCYATRCQETAFSCMRGRLTESKSPLAAIPADHLLRMKTLVSGS